MLDTWQGSVDESEVEAARTLQRQGNDRAALAAYRKLRTENPANYEAWLGEVALTTEAAERQRLAQELEGARVSISDEEHRAELTALESLVRDEDEGFEKELRAALAAAPQSPLVHGALARYMESRGNDAEAFEHWRSAGRIRNAPAFALRGLARRQLSASELKDAAPVLERYLELRPKDVWARYNLGTIYLDTLDRPSDAFDIFQRLAEEKPDDIDIALNASTAALLSSKTAEALDLMRAAERKFPENPHVYFNLAIFYADHDRQPQRAIDYFRRYLAKGGEHNLRVDRWIKELSAEIGP